MRLLSKDQLDRVLPAETHAFPGPIPTQIVSSDEFLPLPQTERQREVEARLKVLGNELGRKQGLSRRAFFKSAAGMAAAFVAMNAVYGRLFDTTRAEAADPARSDERAKALAGQFIMDTHTHFQKDDTRMMTFVNMREVLRKLGWNPEIDHPQTIEDLKFDSYFKEIFLDSDTKVALISSAPSDIPDDWVLTNEQTAAARARVNARLGSRRLLSHSMMTPGHPGWLEALEQAVVDFKPDSIKGYTIGDNYHKNLSHYPWHLDDEKLVYPAYEKISKAGIRNVCVHKGIFPEALDRHFPNLRPYCDVRDVGKAAQDWPQLNFIIYHSGYRMPFDPTQAEAYFEKTGRIEWLTDLADIPGKYGVSNVYADLGQVVAWTLIAAPRLGAGALGSLIKGMGVDHVIWGSDAVWTGSPQWQIEGLRRLEIPEDMQKQHGFAPLGPADGPVKTAIFGENVAKLYGYDRHAELGRPDRLAELKKEYERLGADRSNLRYGYVAKG
jgi:uncharacterized protein